MPVWPQQTFHKYNHMFISIILTPRDMNINKSTYNTCNIDTKKIRKKTRISGNNTTKHIKTTLKCTIRITGLQL